MNKYVNVVEDEDIADFAGDAKELAPHEEDIPCFALAMAMECAIWSNEQAFKNQDRVKAFSTSEIINILSEMGIIL